MSETQQTEPAEQVINLPPEAILADDNSRWGGLKPSRLETLKQSIVESGGILSPVEVEPLETPQNGFTHRLTAGFYRHAAVSQLNAEGAGLSVPAIVRVLGDEKLRLQHQLTENVQRENQSPMDQAVAIKKLMDAGVSRKDIRRIFAKAGGRKGNVVTPMSNAWVNMTLRLLDLPKAVQEKVHDGRVGFAAAYELGRVSPEKRAAVLERAEAERIALLEREEADEEKFLAAEKKAADAAAKAEEAEKEAAVLRAEVQSAESIVKAKADALKKAEKTPVGKDEKEKAAAVEAVKAAQADLRGAQKVHKDAANKLATTIKKAQTAAEAAEEQKARLEAARHALKPKTKADKVGAAGVKEAAKAEGEETGLVPLSASEMRQAIKDASKCDYPKVAQIATAVLSCFSGKTTPKELINDLGVLTGEVRVTPAPKPAAAKPAAKK